MIRLLCLACAVLVAACASTPDTQSTAQTREDKEYRTGSRIPMRDPVSASPTTTAKPSALPGAARMPSL